MRLKMHGSNAIRLFAQSLKKPIFVVLLDSTALPPTLISVSSVATQTSGSEAATALISHFPPSQSTEPLLTLSEQAAHEYIRMRKEAIDAATTMLKQGDRREEVLAVGQT